MWLRPRGSSGEAPGYLKSSIFTIACFSAYKIHISSFTYDELIKFNKYIIEKRGTIPVKVNYIDFKTT